MAKLIAPLFSFGASGSLAKTLVYFPWKGIHAVRSYVVPANPNSAGQQTQRGYLSDAVDSWHLLGLDALDVAAWNRYAATLAQVMSGFNAFCRAFIDFLVAAVALADVDMVFNGALVDDADGTFSASCESPAGPTQCDMIWGTSPTSLINLINDASTTPYAFAPATNVAGQTIYARFQPKNVGNAIRGQSGIYRLVMA